MSPRRRSHEIFLPRVVFATRYTTRHWKAQICPKRIRARKFENFSDVHVGPNTRSTNNHLGLVASLQISARVLSALVDPNMSRGSVSTVDRDYNWRSFRNPPPLFSLIKTQFDGDGH